MRLACLIALTFACGARSPRLAKPDAELSPALAPLAWWLGDWQVESGATGTEHWIASSGVIFGIALQDNAAFEVIVVDDGEGRGTADGKLRLWAMPAGMTQVEFALASNQRAAAVTFEAPQNAFPKVLTYARDGEALTATIAGDGKSHAFRYRRASATSAPALEAADRAFAKATARRGIEGWVDAFDPKGGMMTKGGRIEGHAAIRTAMTELLATTTIAWAPIASGVRRDLGFTVGKAVFTGKDARWQSTYVTVWRKQRDGAWKVLFDTGRTVQAE